MFVEQPLALPGYANKRIVCTVSQCFYTVVERSSHCNRVRVFIVTEKEEKEEMDNNGKGPTKCPIWVTIRI